MSTKPLNCWEVMQCGREPGGARVAELGECPVPTAEEFDGVNKGLNGGRYCWAIAGTLCGGKVQGHMARKLQACTQCEFFRMVEYDEDREFVIYASKCRNGC